MRLNHLLMPSLFALSALSFMPAHTLAQANDAAPAADEPKKPAGAKLTPVPAEKLKATLPEKLGDLKRGDAQATDIKSGEMQQSSVTCPYAVDPEKDTAPTGNVTIVDTADPETHKGMTMWADAEIDVKTDKTFQKIYKIEGQPAMQQYNGDDKAGTIVIGIGERITLSADFQNVSTDEFKKLCEQLPVKAVLALVKK